MATDLNSSPIRTIRADQFIERELGQTSSRLRTAEIAWAVLAAVAWALALLLTLVVVDAWMVNLGGQTRLIGLGVLIAGSVLIFCYGALPPLLRRINPQYVARMIEKSGNSFHNSLVNYLLVRSNPQKTRSMVYEAVSQRAANDLSSLDEDRRVDFSSSIRMGAIVAGLVALLVAYIIFSPRNPWTSIGRIIAPGSRLAPASVVTVTNVTPGDAIVYYGDRLRITCDVRGRTDDQPVQLIFTSRDGQIKNATVLMNPGENESGFNGEITCGTEGICTDLDYYVACGDGRSPDYHIAVRANPTITVAQVEIVPPEYTRLPPSIQLGRGEIRAPEGSTVRISAASNQEMKLAWIELVRASQAGTVATNAENVEVVQSVNMEIVDARQSRGEFVLQLDADRKLQKFSHYRIRFRTMDDQRNELASLHPVQIIPDAAPEVSIIRPETTPVELPANSRMLVEVHATDFDYEISKVELVMDHRGSRLLDRDVEMPLEKTGQKVIGRYPMDPKALNLREGDEVVFYARASDNRISPYSYAPDPNVSITSSYTVRIVAADPNAKSSSESPNPAQPNAGNSSENQGGTNPDKSQQGKPGEQNSPESGDGNKSEQGGNKSEQGNQSGQDNGGTQSEKAESEAGGNKGQESSETGEGSEKADGAGEKGSQGANSQEQQQAEGEGEKQAGADSGNAGGASGQESGDQSETGESSSGNSDGKAGTEGNEQGSGANSNNEKTGGNEASSSDANPATGATESSDGKGAEGSSSNQNPTGGEPGGQNSPAGAQNSPANGGEKTEPGTSDSGTQNSAGQTSSGNNANEDQSSGSGGQRDESLRDGAVEPLSKQATASEKFEAIQEYIEKLKDSQKNQESSGESSQPDGNQQSSESGSDNQSGKPEAGGNQSGNSKPGENPDNGRSDNQEAGSSGNGKTGENQSTGNDSGNPSGGKDPSTDGSKSEGQGAENASDNATDKGNDPAGKSDPKSTDSQSAASGDEKANDNSGNESGSETASGNEDPDQKTGSGSTGEPATDNPEKSNADSSDEKSPPGSDAESNGAESKNNSQDSGKPGDPSGKSNDDASKSGSPDSNQNPQSDSAESKQAGDSSDKRPGGASDPGGSSQPASSNTDPGGNSSGTGAASRGGSGGVGTGSTGNGGDLVDPQTTMTQEESEQLEYNRAATDLVLQTIDDLKGQPNDELLKRLNMSEQDLKDFLDRWKKMRDLANTGDPAAQKRYTEALRSLSLRSADLNPSAVKVESDNLGGMAEDGGVNRPSAELAPEFRAFMKSRNRVESGNGKK